MTSTIKALAEITDEGVFERLATAVLRECSEDYASLVHCGVNAEGKTIRSPLDGIGFIAANSMTPPRLIAVHHTTAARRNLRRKWLNEPAQRFADRPAEPGDFVKTRDIVQRERENERVLAATLILTSSIDPPEDVVRDVHAAGRATDIDIDFWSGSRIAHYLDVSANGQWLRREHLGIEPERLSAGLLADLSLRSLVNFCPYGEPSQWVQRTLDDQLEEAKSIQPAVFLAAESGLGKSVACYKLLQEHVADGGFGLFLSDMTIAVAVSLEAAVSEELRKLHPQLAEGCEEEAFALCTEAKPLLIICEDVNRSGRPQALIERMVDWVIRQSRRRWKLVCPLWPDVIAALGDQHQKSIQKWLIMATVFTPEEGQAAVTARARATKRQISALDAIRVSSLLGHDPLLIALYDIGVDRSAYVVDDFIDRSLGRLASGVSSFSRGELRTALRELADRMLSERRINPEWGEIVRWAGTERHFEGALRTLVRSGEVVRLSTGSGPERVLFRHDRVRDALLVDVIAEKLKSGAFEDKMLSEPFFAEHFGSALLREGVLEGAVEIARRRNPLALFSALREFGEPDTPFKQMIVSQITDWVRSDDGQDRQNAALRWQAVNMIAETTSTAVLALPFSRWSHPLAFAFFRNGNVNAGLVLCRMMEPGISAPWYERQIDHVLGRYGIALTQTIITVLSRTDIDRNARVGALRLAGYIADERLGPAIEACWIADVADRDSHLDEYLWAAAYCCSGMAERLLGPICDAWARLPGERIGGISSQRDNLAADNIRWAFRRKAPVHAIEFFVARAAYDDLKWQLLYMLHSVDDPDALEFAVRQFAAIYARGSFVPYALDARREWRDRDGRRMSTVSRARLLSLWNSPEEHGSVRRQAFQLWSAAGNRNDVEMLRLAESDEQLADAALLQRLEYGDRSATPAVLSKLDDPQNSYYWWREVAHIWSSQIFKALERELQRRKASVAIEWNTGFETDVPVSELLMSIPASEAEALLIDHWGHLRLCGPFIITAFYVATPRLIRMAGDAICDCPTPMKLFEYLGMRCGIRTNGRPGLTRRDQVVAFGLHAEHFDDFSIHTLWQWCNEKGWHDLRRRFFDARVDRKYGRLFLDRASISSELDRLTQPAMLVWIDGVLEAWTQTGASIDDIMSFVSGWLQELPTIERLQVAAAAVGHAGLRRHLALLDLEIQPSDLSRKIRLDTAFNVHRRTLR